MHYPSEILNDLNVICYMLQCYKTPKTKVVRNRWKALCRRQNPRFFAERLRYSSQRHLYDF